jgi:hypothetical protein
VVVNPKALFKYSAGSVIINAFGGGESQGIMHSRLILQYIVRQGSYIRPRGGNFRGDNNSINYVNNEAEAAVQAEAEMRRKVTLKRCASMRFVGRSESGRWT